MTKLAQFELVHFDGRVLTVKGYPESFICEICKVEMPVNAEDWRCSGILWLAVYCSKCYQDKIVEPTIGSGI